jgi:hypothetical protein
VNRVSARLLGIVLLSCACAVAQVNAPPAPGSAAPAASSNSSSAALPAADPSAAKAHQLLDQMIAALGGPAWLNYKTLSQQGRSYSFYHGKPTSAGTLFWRFYEYPDKERRELTKQRDVIDIYNGGKGYEKTYKGTAAADAKSVQQVLRSHRHSLEVVVRQWLKDPKTLLFYQGQSVANQQLVDVVTLFNRENDQVSIGIDAHTHLPIDLRYSWRDADRYKVDEEVVYGNYRRAQGIETPFTITSYRDGEMSGQSFLYHAAYNTAFAPGFFDAKVTYNPETYNPRKKK